MKAKRATPRRRSTDTEHVHGLLEWADVRLVAFARAHGHCERCGVAVTITSMEAHHRMTRRLGPDCPCNALCLCSSCHHGPDVHGGPERARALGTIVSRHAKNPAEEPVEIYGLGRVLLWCHGSYGDPQKLTG